MILIDNIKYACEGKKKKQNKILKLSNVNVKTIACIQVRDENKQLYL